MSTKASVAMPSVFTSYATPLIFEHQPGVIAEELRNGGHLQRCLHQRHTRVERIELSEFFGMLVDQVRDPPDDLGALAARQLGPDTRLEGGLRPGGGLVDRLWSRSR